MRRVVNIGCQDFEQIRSHQDFYIDKTSFIKEWWENRDAVTLITRPRRFGKTLTMDMIEKFFSVRYANQGELFEGLSIWKEEYYQKLQGTYPVIFLSFAGMKGSAYPVVCYGICELLIQLFRANAFLLDEYDTPMQDAYVNSYWEEIISFIQRFFHAAFKTNPYLERAILTGVTRISKESIFSDLNNLEVVTTTSKKYADKFGFTEQEVFAALKEYGLFHQRQEVKCWYDGFTFGDYTDIYNPWSIINYLDKRELGSYWVNTSSNHLAGKLIQEGSIDVKQEFELLLSDQTITTELEEQIAFYQLPYHKVGIWSLLLASGYLKVVKAEFQSDHSKWMYTLSLTNKEVKGMFLRMIGEWFTMAESQYNNFIKALLLKDVKAMNKYMNEVALVSFSYFDTGKKLSEKLEPERFYHGFVLGLLVELTDRYRLTSNRESGFGRYDVMLEPRNHADNAIIIEFKVYDPEEEEQYLQETVQSALAQIREKQYASVLIVKGIPEEHIWRYGFAFEGKKVLIETDREVL